MVIEKSKVLFFVLLRNLIFNLFLNEISRKHLKHFHKPINIYTKRFKKNEVNQKQKLFPSLDLVICKPRLQSPVSEKLEQYCFFLKP
jgi:hypothetical protein